MILEFALGVGVVYLLTKGGYLPNKSSVIRYSISPRMYSKTSRPTWKVREYKTRSEAMAEGRSIASRLKKLVKVSGRPKVEVFGYDDDKSGMYYLPVVSFSRTSHYGRDLTKAEQKKEDAAMRKVMMMKGRGYNRMHIAS